MLLGGNTQLIVESVMPDLKKQNTGEQTKELVQEQFQQPVKNSKAREDTFRSPKLQCGLI